MNRPLIAVIGQASLPVGDVRETLAFELGVALVGARYRIVCGGGSGVMAAVSRGAKAAPNASDMDVLGVLPGAEPATANPHVDVALPTSLGHYRNGIVVHGQAVVAIGGGAGTLSELALAWAFDRPVIAYRTEGWSGKLADQRIDDRIRFADRPDDRVYGVDSADEVLALLATWVGPSRG